MKRALLLALLPLIALAVYLDGQRYDPEVLAFSKPAGGEMEKFLPAQAGPLKREERIKIFTKDNLFEYINGHAEFFISAGFKALGAAGYMAEGSADPTLSVDLYDMGAAENAFGVMTQESAGKKAIAVGFMGARSKTVIMFIKGPYYVKVTSFKKGADMLGLATAVANAFGELETKLPAFNVFPAEGARADGRGYVREDYMGLDFMTGVFEQKYRREGAVFTAFTLEPEAGPEKFIENFTAFYREMGIEIRPLTDMGGGWDIIDKYEGNWSLARLGSRFVGVRELDGPARRAFLAGVIEKNKTP